MARVLRLPEQLVGVVIHDCWECPFSDSSDPKNAHCNVVHHFGIEKPTPMDDGFELGCPLEESPDVEQKAEGKAEETQNHDVPV
jgi:hypothetical protein